MRMRNRYNLFMVMPHATTRNLNCFSNNKFCIFKTHLHCELSLKYLHDATDMLNLFKTMIIPIILLFSAHIAHLIIVSLIEIAV
jgi:hypothetical protein